MSILASSSEFVRPGSENEPSWREEVRTAVRDAGELCHRLGLSPDLVTTAESAAREFSVFVPPSYLARIRRGDPHDPLLRQVLPVANETDEVPGFSADPVSDAAAVLQPGVLQKYAGRALLITTGACAVHCRYCFRRHFPYEEAPHSDAAWDGALATIAADPTISEVILSGGDPLMLVDERLSTLVKKIAALPRVERLRVHTRLPIMIPSRVTEELVTLLSSTHLTPLVVIHANHAQELDKAVAQSLARLQCAGVMLLNQAVLLRGVNDSVEAQITLSKSLVQMGVLPYYLHQLDRVRGAAHFEVPIAEGKKITAAMRAQLPGYMVPKYVQEVPGELSKTILKE